MRKNISYSVTTAVLLDQTALLLCFLICMISLILFLHSYCEGSKPERFLNQAAQKLFFFVAATAFGVCIQYTR